MPLTDIRQALREQTLYIADGSILDKLEWYQTNGGFDRLVTKAAANQYKEDLTAYKNDPTTIPTGPPASPPAAVLSAIVRLKKEDYYLIACGDWKPNWSKGALANVRASAVAEDPNIPVIDGDYEAGWANLFRLLEKKVDADGLPITGLITCPSGANGRPNHRQGFRISHRIFEAKKKYDPATSGRATRGIARGESLAGIDDPEYIEFSVKEWPLRHPEAKPELQKLETTHVPIPIPVYGLEREGRRDLILPTDYEAKLKGAVVQLEFHINHWKINDKHSFTADITKMRVLVPPVAPRAPDTPTPKRKRVRRFDRDEENGNSRDGSPAPIRRRL
ncbi:hypothetical protein NMY22_g6663 [Coprinellus aureogranulatus]|nr:hypothetical protein NMY22_g6663 [Coprinellus aureogranulatus]